jgi:hypothetical protein
MTCVIRFLRRALALAFAGLAASALSTTNGSIAAAQDIVGAHYQEELTHSCNAAVACQLKFSKIPAGKLLLVNNVSCRLVNTNNVSLSSLGLLTGVETFLTPVYVSGKGPPDYQQYYQANNAAGAFAVAGSQPSVLVIWFAKTNTSMECSIAGTLSNM